MKQYCKECKEVTEWRYLDCEDCRREGKECIDICVICGADDGEEHGKEAEFEPQAWLTICNYGGIEIEINPSGDGLRWRYNFGEIDPELDNSIHESEIIYDPDPDDPAGEFLAGFMIGEDFYPLNQFMRLDYGK